MGWRNVCVLEVVFPSGWLFSACNVLCVRFMDLIILCYVISFVFPKRSTGELSTVTSYWNQSANSVRVGMVVYVHVLEQPSKERFYWVCYVFEVAETNTLI